MDVALIDAGGANLGSVRYALERLGVAARVVREGRELAGAERVILPGVGAAAPAMRALRDAGFVEPLRARAAPLLGICLGMQLLFDASEEGDVECLGLLPGTVARLDAGAGLRWPHMGWNALERTAEDPLLAGLGDGDHAYFVHGYAAPVGATTIAASTHGARFSSIVRDRTVLGVQFHPERSSAGGARLLGNFLAWPA